MKKRRSRKHPIQNLIKHTVDLLEPYIRLREVDVEYDFVAEDPSVWCSKAAMESIITNFLTNSMQAYTRNLNEDTVNHDTRRIIKFRTRITSNKVTIEILDNGPGITGISIADIWLPGKTTTTSGTGLGLTIVRDIVNDLNGVVEASEKGELGGATFTMVLPLR